MMKEEVDDFADPDEVLLVDGDHNTATTKQIEVKRCKEFDWDGDEISDTEIIFDMVFDDMIELDWPSTVIVARLEDRTYWFENVTIGATYNRTDGSHGVMMYAIMEDMV